MGDDNIRYDADRDGIKECGGASHAKPGKLRKHADYNPHRTLILHRLFANLLPEYRRRTKLIFCPVRQPIRSPFFTAAARHRTRVGSPRNRRVMGRFYGERDSTR
jgi:hypothetical protein